MCDRQPWSFFRSWYLVAISHPLGTSGSKATDLHFKYFIEALPWKIDLLGPTVSTKITENPRGRHEHTYLPWSLVRVQWRVGLRTILRQRWHLTLMLYRKKIHKAEQGCQRQYWPRSPDLKKTGVKLHSKRWNMGGRKDSPLWLDGENLAISSKAFGCCLIEPGKLWWFVSGIIPSQKIWWKDTQGNGSPATEER